jgi:hypothetical protein
MFVDFKKPYGIDKVMYAEGVQEVPDALNDHPFFALIVKVGGAEIVNKPGAAIKSPAKEEVVASEDDKTTKAKKEA